MDDRYILVKYMNMWIEIWINTIEFIFVDHRLWFFLLANIIFFVISAIVIAFLYRDY